MPGKSIFSEDWRDCLCAHYMYVVRNEDHVTEPTLRSVMHQVGFGDSELAELRVRATMRVEDVGEDFVPDLEILDSPSPAPVVAAPEPVKHGQEEQDKDEDDAPSLPRQLSMF